MVCMHRRFRIFTDFFKVFHEETDKINKKKRKLELSSVQAGSPLILLSTTYLASCPRRNAKGRSTGRNEISGEDFIMPSSINQPKHSKARIGQLGCTKLQEGDCTGKITQ